MDGAGARKLLFIYLFAGEKMTCHFNLNMFIFFIKSPAFLTSFNKFMI